MKKSKFTQAQIASEPAHAGWGDGEAFMSDVSGLLLMHCQAGNIFKSRRMRGAKNPEWLGRDHQSLGNSPGPEFRSGDSAG